MKKYCLYIFVLALLVSCGEELIPKPNNLIPKDKMVEIIQEMAIMNVAKSTNADVLRDNEINPTYFVLNKYGVDSLQFVESDRYYVSKPAEYKDIYETVEKQLQTRGKAMGEAKRVKDSIALKNRLEGAREKAEALDKATDSLP